MGARGKLSILKLFFMSHAHTSYSLKGETDPQRVQLSGFGTIPAWLPKAQAVCASRAPCSSAIWGLSLCTDLLGLLSCVALPTPFLSAGSGLAETLLIVGFFSLNPYPLDRTRLGSSCTGRSGVAFCKARQGKKRGAWIQLSLQSPNYS